MADELIAFKEPADRITVRAATAVTGRRLVMITGNETAEGLPSVGHTAADGDLALGVVEQTAAAGANVGLIRIEAGHIVPLSAAGAIAAGESLMATVDGEVIPAAGAAGDVVQCVAIAQTAAANDTLVKAMLSRHVVVIPA